MRREFRFAAGLALALGLASAACAQQAPAKTCGVEAQSRNGGAIQIVPASQIKGATAPHVLWAPVATGPGVILLVTYSDGALTHMDEPSGLMIRFRTPGDRSDSLSLLVKARNGRTWRFDGDSIITDPNNQAHVAFGLDWPYGRGVLAAIADSQPLSISVEQDGQITASAAFGLDNIDARDTLLAQARTRFQTLDQSACLAQPGGAQAPAHPAG
jgi:hypothetical protein